MPRILRLADTITVRQNNEYQTFSISHEVDIIIFIGKSRDQ